MNPPNRIASQQPCQWAGTRPPQTPLQHGRKKRAGNPFAFPAGKLYNAPMLKRKARQFLRSLKEGGKVLLSSVIGVLSLALNFYFVWTSRDWSGQPYYDLYQQVITVTAATAAVAIAVVIYSSEVVKVFGETFLAKRYSAGREDGLEEGVEKGRKEGLVEGREEGLVEGREEGLVEGRVEGREEGLVEGREERDAELLTLLEERPELTLDQFKELLRSRNAPRNGKSPGTVQED